MSGELSAAIEINMQSRPDEGEEEFICYFCRDFKDHESCIGVPCNCPCPLPEQRERERLRERALAKLTPRERWALNV